MPGGQLFATDVIAYAFQVYKTVNQNEGKEDGKESGDSAKGCVVHSSIRPSCNTKREQGQFVNEELHGFRAKRNVSVYLYVLHGSYLWMLVCSLVSSFPPPFLSSGALNGLTASLMLSRYSLLVFPSRASFQSL